MLVLHYYMTFCHRCSCQRQGCCKLPFCHLRRREGGSEDTSRSGKGLSPSALPPARVVFPILQQPWITMRHIGIVQHIHFTRSKSTTHSHQKRERFLVGTRLIASNR